MEIEEIIKVENCIESKFVYDFFFVQPIEKDFIDYLSELGKLIYTQETEEPYYKIIVRGKYTIKGVERKNYLRVLLPTDESLKYLEEIKKYINKYCD